MRKRNGYVVISITLIVLMVSIGVTAALSFLSIGNLKIAAAESDGKQALLHTDSCLEETLLRLKSDPSYVGGVVTFLDGECQVGVQLIDGAYVLGVTFLKTEKYRRSVEARAKFIDGVLQLDSWDEKAVVVE